MATNIRIITSIGGRTIDYEKPEDLSIKMSRVADDMADPEARYGEFSYSFSLPITRNNMEIFGFANVPTVRNKFRVNPIEVKVFNNDLLLLDGQLELEEIGADRFKCVFYSKLTQLSDALQDKNMQDITCCPKISGWNYETSIRTHMNAGYDSCDETPYQFPFIFYNTFYCPTSVFTGLTDTVVDANGTTNHYFQRERDQQNWYYYINRSSLGENDTYFQWFPLAFYLKPMMEYMLKDIGWSMGGSFWEDANIKRILVPYVGDTDVYDRACYCSDGGAITGSTCTGTLMLNTALFMPDMDCIDFLENIIKLFNLYLIIDATNKTIIFETYDVMFNNKTSPYNIDKKVIGDMVVSRMKEYDPTVRFKEVDNQMILGDNRYIASSGTSAYSAIYKIATDTSLFDGVFNHKGTTEGEVEIDFGAPVVKRMRIHNKYNMDGVDKSAGDHVFFVPFISKQLPTDNGGKAFSKKDTDSVLYNNEASVQYKGEPILVYYYGISSSDFEQKTSLIGDQKDYFFFNFENINQKITFTSPFALKPYRANINNTLANTDSGSSKTMLAGYMQSAYLMMAGSGGIPTGMDRDFSLILSDDNSFGDTLYTKFHSNKYKRYRDSEILEGTIRMDGNDWRAMQINTPIKYNSELYSIMEIKSYDVVKGTATITLIKML
jgi:hypothetical protein